MADRTTRALLVVLLVSGVTVGVWAAFFPLSFYADFPGGGHAWVSADGPYNEHLVRDVGNLFLGLSVVALGALLRPLKELVLVAAAAFLVEGLPHLTYHLRHLDLYDTSDKVGNVVSLSVGVVVPIVLLVHAGRRIVAAPAAPHAAAN
jgi:hypothetical protein